MFLQLVHSVSGSTVSKIMEEVRSSEQKTDDSTSTDTDMDLLSLTLRSLDWRSSRSKEDFLGLEEGNASASIEAQKLNCAREEATKLEKEESRELSVISLAEAAWHDTVDNCWIVVYDFVYDCTDFLRNHPGGSDVILEYAGRDATLAFVGTGHSSTARKTLDRYLIGELPPEERIFRVPNGVKVPEF